MSTTVYTINKGVNRSVEFRGLKAQYIWWLGGGVVGLLALFAGLYIGGVNAFVCLGIVGVTGTIGFRQVYRLSRVYGAHGLMKRAAARRMPARIRSDTRKLFTHYRGPMPVKKQKNGKETE
jgi:hypothetical protein